MSRTTTLVSTLAAVALGALVASGAALADGDQGRADVARAAVAPGAMDHVVVIDLENESFADTFGATSAARYLNDALLAQGQLLTNYYATSHVSLVQQRGVERPVRHAPQPLRVLPLRHRRSPRAARVTSCRLAR